MANGHPAGRGLTRPLVDHIGMGNVDVLLAWVEFAALLGACLAILRHCTAPPRQQPGAGPGRISCSKLKARTGR